MRRDALGHHPQRRRGLALGDHRLLARRIELTRLEAEAGVVAGEARDVAEAAGAPLLVDDGEQGELGKALRDRRERRPQRRRAPARSRPSCRPRPSRPAARRRGRADDGPRARPPCRDGRAAGPAGAGAGERREQVGGVSRRWSRAGRSIGRPRRAAGRRPGRRSPPPRRRHPRARRRRPAPPARARNGRRSARPTRSTQPGPRAPRAAHSASSGMWRSRCSAIVRRTQLWVSASAIR